MGARHAKAAVVAKGQRVKVINTHGTQVVDCWAFNADNLGEFMSMEHCRVSLGRYRPRAGDVLITNQRRPILKLLKDTSLRRRLGQQARKQVLERFSLAPFMAANEQFYAACLELRERPSGKLRPSPEVNTASASGP